MLTPAPVCLLPRFLQLEFQTPTSVSFSSGEALPASWQNRPRCRAQAGAGRACLRGCHLAMQPSPPCAHCSSLGAAVPVSSPCRHPVPKAGPPRHLSVPGASPHCSRPGVTSAGTCPHVVGETSQLRACPSQFPVPAMPQAPEQVLGTEARGRVPAAEQPAASEGKGHRHL